jgi:hypothetical protein
LYLSEDLRKLKIALANCISASVLSIRAFSSRLLAEARIVIPTALAFRSVIFGGAFVAKEQRFGKLVDEIYGLSFSGVRIFAFLERRTVAASVFQIAKREFRVFMGYSNAKTPFLR